MTQVGSLTHGAVVKQILNNLRNIVATKSLVLTVSAEPTPDQPTSVNSSGNSARDVLSASPP